MIRQDWLDRWEQSNVAGHLFVLLAACLPAMLDQFQELIIGFFSRFLAS